MIDNTVLISGAPMRFGGILFRQPTLGQIYRDPDVGKAVYDSYLYLVSLDVEGFLQATGLTDVYMELPRDIREQIGIFDLLTAEPSWRALLLEALSFFTGSPVRYDPTAGEILVDCGEEERVLDKESYDQAREFIMRSACLECKAKQSELRFYNKRAKEAWERLMKHREEMRKKPQKVDPSFSLWNIIGAVTSRHPSLNLTNIWQLTVYQLYDQFARVRDQVAFDVYSTRWAVWGKDKLDQSLWFKQERDNKV